MDTLLLLKAVVATATASAEAAAVSAAVDAASNSNKIEEIEQDRRGLCGPPERKKRKAY
jgi:hypothetical protein